MALAAVAFGCSSSDGDGSGPSGNCNSDIEFLQAGKYQKFKVTQFGFDAGTMKLSFGECGGSGFPMTMENRSTTNALINTVNGFAWQDGAFLLTDATGDGAPFFKIYKKDAALNDTWTETDEDGATIVHTVVDVDSLITVPAGSFHCKVYHYEKSDIFNDSYIFWHDEFGQIMEDAGFVKYELMEHN